MHQRRCLAQGNTLSRMAPHLAESQHALIHDMIASKTSVVISPQWDLVVGLPHTTPLIPRVLRGYHMERYHLE